MTTAAIIGPWLLALLLSLPHQPVAGTTVSGTVSGTDQGFLAGATLVIDGPVHREARTDADGRFTLAEVPSGRYELRASADGYLPLERPLDVGTASVSVDILLLRIPSVP